MSISRLSKIIAVMALGLSGCAATGLLFTEDVQEYEPRATWGSRAVFGFCPSFSPSLRLDIKKPDWLMLDVGIWDSKQTALQKFKEPTLFIVLHQSWTFSIEKQKLRAETPIPITASSPSVEVTLADGTKKLIHVKEFSEGFSYQQGELNIYLDVPPQDMTVALPDLRVGDELLKLGPIHFTYQHGTRHPC